MSQTPEITVHEVQEHLDNGAVLIDVREQHEFDEARIPGSQLLPLSEIMNRYEELPRDRPLVVHCRSGARSARAVDYLIEQGYDAVNVGGGILAWKEAELPVESGKSTSGETV